MFVLLSADTQLVTYSRKVSLIHHFMDALTEFIEKPSSKGTFGSFALHYSTVSEVEDSNLGIFLCHHGYSYHLL